MWRKFMFVWMALALSLFGVVPVFAQSSDQAGAAGAVYIMSNAAGGNEVQVFNRAADGSLTYSGSYSTGGLGSGVGVTVPPDPLGSQHSLVISSNGRWLLAVNAGSDTISVFQILPDGLRLTDTASSGGSYPVSLTASHGLVYVLNAGGEGSISGFKLSASGQLQPLDGSTRSLNAATPPDGAQPNILEAPAQIGFSPSGKFLVVTNKGGVSGQGQLMVFPVSGGIPADQPAVTGTAHPVPFSFTFDNFGHLVVVDASAGTITSYGFQSDGSLQVLDTVANGQAAVCWISGPALGKYLFSDNTGSGTISTIKAGRDGSLTLLDAAAGVTGAGTLPLDNAVSHNGRFLYALEAGMGKIAIFQINADGSLTAMGTAGDFPPISGFQGIAAW